MIPHHSDFLAKIDHLKHENTKLRNELEAWKSEARAWPRGLGKISPTLRTWLERQEEKPGVSNVRQSVDNRRHMLNMLRERGLLSDKQRKQIGGV